MLSKVIENRISSTVAIGGAAVALLVTDRISLDPVNVGKMFLLVAFAGAILPMLLIHSKKVFIISKSITWVLVAFILTLLISIILSENSWERGFYGAYGRNTGLLTYMGLAVFLLASSLIKEESNVNKVVRSFFLVGFLNVIYNILVIFEFDVFAWENPYNNPIGTFGNPNFIASFMGMYITALMANLLFKKSGIRIRVFYLIQIPLSIFIIRESGALQGYLVTGLGINLLLGFLVWFKIKNRKLLASYAFATFLLGIVGVLGMLQKGPLASLLYKPSVSFRGEYWAAGLNMGMNKPFFGQGLDSYGTYYRMFRRQSALVSPGPNTVTDTAHNVIIDLFSGSGFLGMCLYLTIIFLVLFKSINFIRNMTFPEPIFILVFTTWICYQAQSIISINQIGLAVWGWILSGLLLSYSKVKNNSNYQKLDEKPKLKDLRSKDLEILSAGAVLSILVGTAVAITIALPPFLVDARMRNAIFTNNAEEVVKQASSFPIDTLRVNRAGVALAKGGLMEDARQITLIATHKYPDDFSGWFILHELTTPESDQRKEIKKKLREIDPFNLEWQ
jgi:O-antigen ligase